MFERLPSSLTPWRVLVALLLTLAAVIVTVRFAFGLGSVTNLSDETPWGIWVGFDILAGIGLAAGGFIMASVVYVFGIERYRPLVRISILTALIGYLLFVIVPVVVVFRSARRMTTGQLFLASLSAVLGFIMHRFNVAVSGMQLIHPTGYFPTWQELVISLALIALGFVAAGLAIHYLPVTRPGGADASAGAGGAYRLPWRVSTGGVSSIKPQRENPIRPDIGALSVLLVCAFVLPATASEISVPDRVAIGELANLYPAVDFDHSIHVEAEGECTGCHHKPFGVPAPCVSCHTDPVAPSAFVHELHWEVEECTGCHEKQAAGDLRCVSCHPTELDPQQLEVIGLKGAYHGLCLGCHGESGSDASCGLCHGNREPHTQPNHN